MAKSYDAVVIGGGPGGYVCAIKLGQLGVKTAVIERQFLGGICLNVGCIPSKALIHAGNFYESLFDHAQELGIDVAIRGFDLSKLKSWKDKVVKKLTGGVEMLLKENRVDIIRGEARFLDPRAVRVETVSGSFDVRSNHFVIATGSRPFVIPGLEPDGKNVITSTEALDLIEKPRHAVVIGGGYIGLELGTYLRKIGSKVTILEGTDKLLGMMDQDCVQVVARGLKRRSVDVVLQAKAKSWKKTNDGLELAFESPEGPGSLSCDLILMTVGRVPNSDTVDIERAGLARNAKGFLETDKQCRTRVPHIFAIGDVAGGALLAHKASREGVVAAEVIAGRTAAFDTAIVPAVVFTDPEIASVGYTLAEARARGFSEAREAQFPMAALGKALVSGEPEGFVKLVADRRTHKLLGTHIVASDASAMLGEAGLALEMGAALEDIAGTIHTHPTLPEALMEAAEAALGHPIHILPRRERASA